MAGRLKVLFRTPYDKNGVTDWPGNAEGRLFLKYYSRDDAGHVFLTPDCASMGEMNVAIDTLHNELEEMRRAAARRFADHDRREALWKKRPATPRTKDVTEQARP